jgi:ubiquinone/menaquinone biosynthesis C-methylase UbiE
VRRLMKGIEGIRILDYGCGYGDLAFALSKTNSVVGIDIDADRIAFCRSQYPELEFHEFDGVTAPFPAEHFDAAISSVVLPFVEHIDSHILDLKRIVRKDGQLMIITANVPTIRNFARACLRRSELIYQLNLLTAKQLMQVMESNGLTTDKSDFYYDPPFVGWNTVARTLDGLANQMASILRLSFAAQYITYRAKL